MFNIGDKIKAKKPHACGERTWEVVRTGADIKLKCTKCGRTVFMSIPDVEKIIALYYPIGGDKNGDQNVIRSAKP
ncbi:MAG: DUF951 domain-containing protein [Clostridia bacterium]|nr:DUF951 domain-containing protein [Clostridia bacterium]